jgi:hypothetical protein
MPFGAFTPLLPSTFAPAADRTEMLRAVAGTVTALAAGNRLALLVDDAQFLDDASAALTHQLAASGQVFVVATVRTGVAPPDHVTALWKDELAERIELAPLDDDGVEQLLALMLGGPVDLGAVQTFAFRSGGNPLFLRELAAAALEHGAVVERDGIWWLEGPLPTSDLLIELLGNRLAMLDPAEREVVELITLGEPLTLAQTAALGVEEALIELEERGVVQVVDDGQGDLQVRLGHPLYGDVVRAGLSRLRVRELVRALADGVDAASGRRPDDALRIALWRLEGGVPVDGGALLEAARIAHSRHELAMGERLAREAADAGGGFEAALLAATLTSLQGRGAEADAELADLELRAGTEDERGLLGVTRVHNLLYGLNQPDAALALAEELVESLPAGEWRDELTAKEVSLLMHLGRTADACDRLTPLLSSVNPRVLVWAASGGAASLARAGRATEALELAQRGRAAVAALEGSHLWPPIFQVVTMAEVLLLAGRLDEAAATAFAGYQQAIEDGSVEARAYMSWYVSETSLAQGRIADVIRFGEAAVRMLRPMKRAPILRFALVPLATALALARRPTDADAALAEIDALGLPPELGVGPELLVARAWTSVSHGDHDRARSLLRESVDMAAARGDRVPQTVALHDLARLGLAKDACSTLGELVTVVEGDLVKARAAHTAALVDMDVTALLAASHAFEGAGALLLAAEAAADAVRVAREHHDDDLASDAAARLASLVDACAPAMTPALALVMD